MRHFICPFCEERLERLDVHQFQCPSKPRKDDPIYFASTGPNKDIYDWKVPCRHCHKKFSDLDGHEPMCPSHPIVRFDKFVESVKIEKRSGFEEIIKVIERVWRDLDDELPLAWKQLDTGFSDSRIEVSKSADFMIYPTIMECRIEQSSSHPSFCRVFITNRQDLPFDIQKMLGPDDELIPSKFKKHVLQVFNLILQEFPSKLSNKINGNWSHAYTLLYKHMKKDTGFGMQKNEIINLVPCLQIQNQPEFCMQWKTKKLTEEERDNAHIYVVPESYFKNDREQDVWQISHSKFEEKILSKCTEDDLTLIKLLNSILATVKNDHGKLCSYHIITHCLHIFESTQQRPALEQYTLHAIDSLIRRLELSDLPDFFMPDCNLLEDVSIRECQEFIETLNQCWKEWPDVQPQIREGKRTRTQYAH